MTHNLTALITRPLSGTLDTEKKLKSMQIECCIEPLMTIKFLPNITKSVKDSLTEGTIAIISSLQGIKSLEHNNISKDTSLIITGVATTEYAKENGFSRIAQGGNTIEETLAYIKKHYLPASHKFVHISGLHISRDLTKALPAYSIRQLVTYEAVETIYLSKITQDALKEGRIDMALFFSARTKKGALGSCL